MKKRLEILNSIFAAKAKAEALKNELNQLSATIFAFDLENSLNEEGTPEILVEFGEQASEAFSLLSENAIQACNMIDGHFGLDSARSL